MLCSLCQHGKTALIGNKPTGDIWYCRLCGEAHCRHIDVCTNGHVPEKRPRGYPYDRVAAMPRSLLTDLVDDVLTLWFHDGDGYNLDKELGADHLNLLTALLDDYGLTPPEVR